VRLTGQRPSVLFLFTMLGLSAFVPRRRGLADVGFIDLPYRIELWSMEMQPKLLIAAAADEEVAISMAQIARGQRTEGRVRLLTAHASASLPGGG